VTGYITVAERKPDPKEFPVASPEMLVPGSVVFNPPPGEVPLDNHYIWWKWVPGANWRHPEGPNSDIKGREKISRRSCLLGRRDGLLQLDGQAFAH